MASRKPRAPARLGAPQSPAHAAALLRALKPLLDAVRETIRAGRIRTPADASAIRRALRVAWPDARILAAVRDAGVPAERAASKAWAPLLRARAAKGLDGTGLHRHNDAQRPKAYDGQALVSRWSRDAAARISSVRDEVAEGLRRDVVRALEAGTDPGELAQRWISQGIPVEFGTLEGRMRVIAQHQLSTLHAQVQSERARAVGVTDFVWRTQQDDRVRDEHVALEGTRHAYADPPDEGLPGTPINCRCFAESIIPDDLAIELGFSIG